MIWKALKLALVWKIRRQVVQIDAMIMKNSEQHMLMLSLAQSAQFSFSTIRNLGSAEQVAVIEDELETLNDRALVHRQQLDDLVIKRNLFVQKFHQMCSDGAVSFPPGYALLYVSEFTFSKKTLQLVVVPVISDMREEYFEALLQNRIWKARWVRVRGTWSFFAAMGLDRAFVFGSFFVRAWKSVN